MHYLIMSHISRGKKGYPKYSDDILLNPVCFFKINRNVSFLINIRHLYFFHSDTKCFEMWLRYPKWLKINQKILYDLFSKNFQINISNNIRYFEIRSNGDIFRKVGRILQILTISHILNNGNYTTNFDYKWFLFGQIL